MPLIPGAFAIRPPIPLPIAANPEIPVPIILTAACPDSCNALNDINPAIPIEKSISFPAFNFSILFLVRCSLIILENLCG